METRDVGAIAAWFLNTLGTALLTGVLVAGAMGGIGAFVDAAWLIWLAAIVGPVTTAAMLAFAKAPSERALAETQAPTT